MVVDNNFYMSLAISEAWKYQGLTYPNPAVGCTIVGENGEILSVEAHQKAGMPHAEVLALQKAFSTLTCSNDIMTLTCSNDIHNFLIKNHNDIFTNITLFTTLEPCSHVGKTPSCANLIKALNIKKVFIGSKDFNTIASNGSEILSTCGVEITHDILKDECNNLLLPFKQWSESRFVFFKLAQRLNGTFDGGVISSKASRVQTHAMRDVCDLLVIGGETVRTDRPILDSRLVDGKAPDVIIYSRGIDFDRTIPLFNVKDREVFIVNELDILDMREYKNIMIEGGSNMLKLASSYIDMYLTYIAPKYGGKTNISESEIEFNILNVEKENKDIIVWMKKETTYE